MGGAKYGRTKNICPVLLITSCFYQPLYNQTTVQIVKCPECKARALQYVPNKVVEQNTRKLRGIALPGTHEKGTIRSDNRFLVIFPCAKQDLGVLP